MRPLTITTRDLSRAPGMTRTLQLDVPAPADMATAVIGVPEGAMMHLDLVLASVHDGILVSGTAEVPVAGECVRCLEPVTDTLVVEVSELYLYPEAADRAADDGDEESVEMLRTDGEELDLEQMLRDAVVMSLPFQPVCAPDCPGLCPVCGVRLADEPGHHHESIDPRFRVLEGYAGDGQT